MVVLWLGLSLLLSVSKHNIWSYYGWVCRCCHLSVNTIYGHIMVGFVVVVVLVNTIYGRIMIGLSLSSVSKHNIWSYYDWVVVCRPSVNIICDCIMIGLLSCFRDVSSTLRFGHSTFRPQTISAIVYI